MFMVRGADLIGPPRYDISSPSARFEAADYLIQSSDVDGVSLILDTVASQPVGEAVDHTTPHRVRNKPLP